MNNLGLCNPVVPLQMHHLSDNRRDLTKLSDTFTSGRLAMHISNGIWGLPNDLMKMDFGNFSLDTKKHKEGKNFTNLLQTVLSAVSSALSRDLCLGSCPHCLEDLLWQSSVLWFRYVSQYMLVICVASTIQDCVDFAECSISWFGRFIQQSSHSFQTTIPALPPNYLSVEIMLTSFPQAKMQRTP